MAEVECLKCSGEGYYNRFDGPILDVDDDIMCDACNGEGMLYQPNLRAKSELVEGE